MMQRTAELAASITGQPVEIYSDDSNASKRSVPVVELERINYPIDMIMVAGVMDSHGADSMILASASDGACHLFRRRGGKVEEVPAMSSTEQSVRAELDRIMEVYRYNRDSGEFGELDMLKGLVLYSAYPGKDVPETAGEADARLERISRERGLDLGGGIGDWGSVRYALESIRDRCPEAHPQTAGLSSLSLLSKLDYRLLGSERTSRVMVSYAEGPATVLFHNPFYLLTAPRGSVVRALVPDEPFANLVCVLAGVGDVRHIVVSEDGDAPMRFADGAPVTAADIEGTAVASPTLATAYEEDLADQLLDIVPDGGRMVLQASSSYLFGLRTMDFRTRAAEECYMAAIVTVEYGFNRSSSDAVVMAIDRKGRVEPTEFYSVPKDADGPGDWRSWEGVVPYECDMDSLSPDDWSEAFREEPSDIRREGVPLGSVAEIRKGLMIRSSDLFPAGSMSGLPYITPRNIRDGSIVLETARKAPSTVKVVARAGDILISCTGAIGEVCRLKEGNPVIVPSYSFAIIRPRGNRYLPEFLELYFRSRDFRDQVEAKKSGRTLMSLSTESLTEILLPELGRGEQVAAVDRYLDAQYMGSQADPDRAIFGDREE